MTAHRVTDLRATLEGHAIEYACDLDRRWFADHPTERSYHRPAVEHEWPPFAGGAVWVEVVQLGPGLRARRPYVVRAAQR